MRLFLPMCRDFFGEEQIKSKQASNPPYPKEDCTALYTHAVF